MLVGGMDHHGQKTTEGIDDDMALASFDHLAAIKTTLSAQFGRFHALTVDNGGTRRGFFADVDADCFTRMAQDLVQGAVSGPCSKVVIETLPGYVKIVGYHAPLTSCFDEIQDGVDDHSEGVFSFSFDIEQGFDRFPLGVSQVGAVERHWSGSLS